MARRYRTFGGWLMHLIILLLTLGVIAFGLALGGLYLAEKTVPAPAGESDALIVLGAQVKADGRPSVQLEWRLEAALAEYRRLPRPIVVCGAQGANEPRPEGLVMRDWLTAQGVPAESVIPETRSTDTRENLRNALSLLPADAGRITVVTSDYHLPRALAIARDLGCQADGIGSPCKPEYWFKNHSREVLAWGKYFAVKWGVLK